VVVNLYLLVSDFANTLVLVALLFYLSYIVARNEEKHKHPRWILIPNFIVVLIYTHKYGMQLQVENSALSFRESSFPCWLVQVACTYFLRNAGFQRNECLQMGS